MSAPQPANNPSLTLPRNSVVLAWLTSSIYQSVLEADRRRVPPDRLAADIVRTAMVNGYVDAVMHDRDA